MPTSLPQQYYDKIKSQGINQSIVGGLCLAGGGHWASVIAMDFIDRYKKSGFDWNHLIAPPAFLISCYTVYVGGYYLYEGIEKICNSKK